MPPDGIVGAHSLLRTAAMPSIDSRWLTEGVNFTPTLCTPLTYNVPFKGCLPSALPPLGSGEGQTHYETCPESLHFPAFPVELATQTLTLGTLTGDPGGEWLTSRIALGLSQVIENRIWYGSDTNGIDIIPSIYNDAQFIGAVNSPYQAVGRVESAILLANAGVGTIHMPPTIAAAVADYLVEDINGTLRTKGTNSKVIVGNYGTWTDSDHYLVGHVGEINLYLGDTIFYDRTTDRYTNVMYEHAWIEAAAAWHTCASWSVGVSSPPTGG